MSRISRTIAKRVALCGILVGVLLLWLYAQGSQIIFSLLLAYGTKLSPVTDLLRIPQLAFCTLGVEKIKTLTSLDRKALLPFFEKQISAVESERAIVPVTPWWTSFIPVDEGEARGIVAVEGCIFQAVEAMGSSLAPLLPRILAASKEDWVRVSMNSNALSPFLSALPQISANFEGADLMLADALSSALMGHLVVAALIKLPDNGSSAVMQRFRELDNELISKAVMNGQLEPVTVSFENYFFSVNTANAKSWPKPIADYLADPSVSAERRCFVESKNTEGPQSARLELFLAALNAEGAPSQNTIDGIIYRIWRDQEVVDKLATYFTELSLRQSMAELKGIRGVKILEQTLGVLKMRPKAAMGAGVVGGAGYSTGSGLLQAPNLASLALSVTGLMRKIEREVGAGSASYPNLFGLLSASELAPFTDKYLGEKLNDPATRPVAMQSLLRQGVMSKSLELAILNGLKAKPGPDRDLILRSLLGSPFFEGAFGGYQIPGRTLEAPDSIIDRVLLLALEKPEDANSAFTLVTRVPTRVVPKLLRVRASNKKDPAAAMRWLSLAVRVVPSVDLDKLFAAKDAPKVLCGTSLVNLLNSVRMAASAKFNQDSPRGQASVYKAVLDCTVEDWPKPELGRNFAESKKDADLVKEMSAKFSAEKKAALEEIYKTGLPRRSCGTGEANSGPGADRASDAASDAGGMCEAE